MRLCQRDLRYFFRSYLAQIQRDDILSERYPPGIM